MTISAGHQIRLDHGYAITRNGPRDRTYNTWAGMIQRCTNPRNPNFDRYGGRGVTVCDRWRTFTNFFEDMGARPEGMTIERRDNDAGYTLDNCRWATQIEQCNNQGRNVSFTIDGITKLRAKWCDDYGVPVSVVKRRVRLGWTLRDSLETTVGAYGGYAS